MIRDFEHWSHTLGEASQLEELRGVRVGIEAAHYLHHRILNHAHTREPQAKEPLVTALGGVPLGFRPHIEADLKKFAEAGIEPFFVFSGLDIAKQDNPFRQRREGSQTNAEAWSLYDQHLAAESVRKFGESSYVTPEDLFRALQAILVEKHIPFLVAPYSAWAQLAYLQKYGQVQAVSGSSELLLFECEQIITSWELETDNPKDSSFKPHFRWIRRSQCVADLRKYVRDADFADDTFIDACLLAGSHFLPTLPNLELPARSKQPKPAGAIEMIMSQGPGRSGYTVVLNNKDDPMLERTDYVDRYRKARLQVKHHPVLTAEGRVELLLQGQLPNDSHEFVGQRLPDEVFHYLSRGLINARILGWRANSEIVESPPIDGGLAIEYHNLVSSKLTPLRTTAINLLSSSLHNWYQHKDIDLKCWFQTDANGKPQASTISMKELPEWRDHVNTWNVRETTIQKFASKQKGCGLLGSAILALQDQDFVSKSFSKRDLNQPLSSTTNEILYNSIWRFLALREYVDTEHKLTAWGKVLVAAVAALKGKPELEEGTVIAVELLRLNILNSDLEMMPYNGAPMRGDPTDQQFNLLISRVAGLGNLRHNPIGFTGPLSQHLLGYGSMINLVRQTLRDLVEVTATHIFMGAFAKRDIDLSDVAFKLPFLLSSNCALSIAVKTYLDEIVNNEAAHGAQAKDHVRNGRMKEYFPQSVDVHGDLDTGFELWDAVLEGVKSGGSGTIKESDKEYWANANEWLRGKR